MTVRNRRVLVVEDDASISRLLQIELEHRGMEVRLVADGLDTLPALERFRPDVVILDILLPGMDGERILLRMRRAGWTMPVIMLTARDAVSDKIRNLGSGADDYLTKPFNIDELVARIGALLRRVEPAERIRVGDLDIDCASRLVRRGGLSIELTTREYDLLLLLARHANQVMPRATLLDRIWESPDIDPNVLDVYIGYLRRKIDRPGWPPLIRTTRGAENLAVLNRDNVMIFALDAEGQVVSQAGFGLEPGTRLPQGEWSRTLVRGEGLRDEVRGNLDLWDDRAIFVHTEPISQPGGESGSEQAGNSGMVSSSAIASVGAGVSYDWVGQHQFAWITIALASFGVVAFVLVTIGSFVLVRHSLAPVQAIAETAAEISEHDLSRRLPVRSGRDELGNLAITFNELLGRLDTAFRDRERTLEQQRQFIADASHELRTPLTSILGYARMLRAWGLERPEVSREAVESLEREAIRMEALVNGMLQLTRGDEGAPLHTEDRDVGALVLDAIDPILASGPGGVTIDANLSSGPDQPGSPAASEGLLALVDADQIHQALMILLDNAVKFSPHGGRVQVTLEADADTAGICVTDEGPGIPPELHERIFERFFRGESSRTTRGSGLGLPIARAIAERHGGTLTVMSEPGHGATFRLRIPRSTAPPAVTGHR